MFSSLKSKGQRTSPSAQSDRNPAPFQRLRQLGSKPGEDHTSEDFSLPDGIVDPSYYLWRYPDVAASGIPPERHFASSGWQERRDPNPFTHLRFVARIAPEAFTDVETLAAHLLQPISHNALMRQPASLEQIRAAMQEGEQKLDEIFNFDVGRYCGNQHDVIAHSPYHPVEHLFWDGLSQNRLRAGGYLDRLLVDIDAYENDYEFLVAQKAPLEFSGFHGLDLSEKDRTVSPDLSGVTVWLGVVLYKNTAEEIRRLVESVRLNLDGAEFSCRLRLWDNSPDPIDLGWIPEAYPDLLIRSDSHPDNPGFALSHNGLMAECFGAGATHYLGLNPDGYLLPGALKAALDFALSKAQPVLVELEAEPISHPKWYHPVTGQTEWVSGAAFLLDAETYRRTGGFDPEFPMYCEDTDLSFRAHEAGVGLFVAPRARYYHDTSDRFHSVEEWRSQRSMIGSWYLCKKWGNNARADLLRTEIFRRAGREIALPTSPPPVDSISPEIRKLIGLERFARSRFWGG